MSALVLAIFPFFMVFAAISDLLTMRISNILVIGLAAFLVVVSLFAGIGFETIGLHLLVALAILAATFAMFSAGWIGGGDAKFAAATVLWIGPGLLLPYLLYAALFGGALTLALLLVRRWPLPAGLLSVSWVERLHNVKSGVPYGIALAAAGLLVYPDTLIFAALAG